MSYDVSIECPTCGTEVVDENHTSNTATMWRSAGCDLAEFDGKKVHELLPSLDKAIKTIAENRVLFSNFEASNGWGTLDSTLRFLRAIRDGAENVRDGIVRVHR